MALKTINDNPNISDTILFEIDTPGADGCFPTSSINNTYKVESVTIYFVERDYVYPGEKTYNYVSVDPASEAAAEVAELAACVSPTVDTIAEAQRLRAVATSQSSTTPFYYNSVRPVQVFGTPSFPAWLRTDPDNSILKIMTDASGNNLYGKFTLEWNPKGEAREGDYFICWTWTPLPAGDPLSSHLPFYLQGDTQVTTAIPTHFTTPGKYDLLLERYTPEMFKMLMSRNDLTPDVIGRFHSALAMGFTDIENLGNQLIDLLDSNSIHESMIPYLSNLFGWKLRSGDPTLWRRQIKNAVPLYKRKGTLGALSDALAECGITLNKYTTLWQVVSPYTFTDSFLVGTSTNFTLSHILLSVESNFQLLLRVTGSSEYTVLDSSYVTFNTVDGVTTMTWTGNYALEVGDLIVVRYLVKSIPSGMQTIEDYIQNSLSLADQRDPLVLENGNYRLLIPLKNWNVHVIEEDDPLFDIIISEREPFAKDVIFGKIRTEFAYSENIYNMEEYNGSLRDSTNPCDIDNDFLDVCGACRSSKFVIDVEMEDLNNDRLKEAIEIVRDFVPFHAVMHIMNVNGGVNEFLEPQVESIETLIMMKTEDNVLSGNANEFFTRYRLNGYDPGSIRRDMLANAQTVFSTSKGVGYNSSVVLYSPMVRFDRIGMNPNRSVLEILSPSANSGIYTDLSNPNGNVVEVSGIPEPLSETGFTYRLSESVYFHPSATIIQDDIFEFFDANEDYLALSIVSQQESTSPWSVLISTYSGTPFPVKDVRPDGSLQLDDPNQLLPTTTTNGISYTLYDSVGTSVLTSTTGSIVPTSRARVNLDDVSVSDVRGFLKLGYYLVYSGQQYPISGYVTGEMNEIYIDGYTSGNAAGVPVNVYNRLVNDDVGYVNYSGMVIDTLIDMESNLGIMNGANPPSTILDNGHWIENYLIVINDNYYRMESINSNLVVVSGPMQDWGTRSNAGQIINYSVIYLDRNSITIDGQDFDYINRSGNDMVEQTVQIRNPMMMATAWNMHHSGGGVHDFIGADEGVTFKIDHLDGSSESGAL